MAPACRVCGRRLADPVSQARGVGPVCDRAARKRTAVPAPGVDVHPGQTELPLPPMQHELTWSN